MMRGIILGRNPMQALNHYRPIGGIHDTLFENLEKKQQISRKKPYGESTFALI
jgi:hypothetical protein